MFRGVTRIDRNIKIYIYRGGYRCSGSLDCRLARLAGRGFLVLVAVWGSLWLPWEV